MKALIYELFGSDRNSTKRRRVFDFCLMALIILNVLAVALETVHSVYAPHKAQFRSFEIFSIVIFTIEYFCRIYASDSAYPASSRAKSACRYIFSFAGFIDIASILPFYLPMFVHLDLRFLRVLRLARILRILKLKQFNDSIRLIYSVIREKKSELFVTCFFVLMFLFIAAFAMYYVEGSVQPDKFSSVFMSFWWAVATLTTVGYGDVYPVTNLGRLISGVIALIGIGLVALPTGIIGAGFMAKINGKKTDGKDAGEKDREDAALAHVALGTRDLEAEKDFYVKAFGATASARYENPKKHYVSYFVTFSEGSRLELFCDDVSRNASESIAGRTHIAISVGSEDEVRRVTDKLRSEGSPVLSEPRTTGDGYYESAVADPEGNKVEITA